MPHSIPTILGLDIGGANLKAATNTKLAASIPFPLWKQPEKLPEALEELLAKFSEVDELAVTMTGELCDCFRTKRDGVQHIVTSVMNVSRSRPIRIWSTDGVFLNTNQAKEQTLKVAAANWHALASYVGRQYSYPDRPTILLDMGTTTTDIIPIVDGKPSPTGFTDFDRLPMDELIYTGVRRTPLCTFLGFNGAAEFFATTHDVYLLLGYAPENANDCDTADGRPATRENAHARISRMILGDPELTSRELTQSLAEGIMQQQIDRIASGVSRVANTTIGEQFDGYLEAVGCVLSGAGEFIGKRVRDHFAEEWRDDVKLSPVTLLSEELGPELSSVAPAYAVAMLAAEQPL